MDENASIQTRISSLELHLEEVRNRSRNIPSQDSSCTSEESESLSEKEFEQRTRNVEPGRGGNESYSSIKPEKDNVAQQVYRANDPMPNYYAVYHPQQDFRQQVDYLHYQLNQNQQIYLSNEKKLKEDNSRIKEELIRTKEECKRLKENNLRLEEESALKNKEFDEESEKRWKDAIEKAEKSCKNLEAEKRVLENKCYQLENKFSKIQNDKTKKPVFDKYEDTTKEEAHRLEIKRYNEKLQALENKISSDRTIIENLKKDLSKADDKIANLENSIIETRNNYSQINKKLSIENDYLKKHILGLTKPNEIKNSDEVNKLKLQLIQKSKEIESLRKSLEKSVDEEQPTPVEIKVSKRKSVPSSSEKLASIKKRQLRSPVKEDYDSLQEINESDEPVEDFNDYSYPLLNRNQSYSPSHPRSYRAQEPVVQEPPSLQNQLIHLQIEKQKLENEYIKLPEFSRNLASKIRKVEVENELESVTKTINSVKSKLRSLNLI